MATTAQTWFYRMPEHKAYYLNERVNATFWDARVGGLWLNVIRAEPPFVMEGIHNGARVRLEWEPNRWLRLATSPANPGLVTAVSNVLRFKPALRFETPENDVVWEWWVEGADKRWHEIQGKPVFRQPERLDAAREAA